MLIVLLHNLNNNKISVIWMINYYSKINLVKKIYIMTISKNITSIKLQDPPSDLSM
jgi:hypothetical protein